MILRCDAFTQPPMLATRIAEYYRDQAKELLLLMDSLTRYAQATTVKIALSDR